MKAKATRWVFGAALACVVSLTHDAVAQPKPWTGAVSTSKMIFDFFPGQLSVTQTVIVTRGPGGTTNTEVSFSGNPNVDPTVAAWAPRRNYNLVVGDGLSHDPLHEQLLFCSQAATVVAALPSTSPKRLRITLERTAPMLADSTSTGESFSLAYVKKLECAVL